MTYIFKKHENVFKNSQDKIKEIWLYSNEGKLLDADCFIGSFIFYKDGTIMFKAQNAEYALEELDFIKTIREEIK